MTMSLSVDKNRYQKPSMPALSASIKNKTVTNKIGSTPQSIPIILLFSFIPAVFLIPVGFISSFLVFLFVIDPIIVGSFDSVLYLALMAVLGVIGAIINGYAINAGSKVGKNRNPKITSRFGFIGTYVGCVAAFFIMDDAGVFGASTFFGAILGIFYAGFATFIARRKSVDAPFCEICKRWYSKKRAINLDPKAAEILVQILDNSDIKDFNLLEYKLPKSEKKMLFLSIHSCAHCDVSKYRVVVSIHWSEIRYDNSMKNDVVVDRSEPYLDILVSSAVGRRLSRMLFK